ncbi:MAG: DUF1456 family protein [Pseudomonadales bacterium]|nr:DUF1456 family protein [Pseudomonadales bacterium]MCP5171215.1 DUF1456 family protein [Pseudomonadales bacterium]MCP5301546.1 DUF1456 family protein [Pseudomonadales bacterium]
MTNNDCLRKIRYIFDYSDKQMIDIFSQADLAVTRQQISSWLKRDDDPDYHSCSDTTLATFLNGLINLKRGRRDGEQPKPEKHINNNIVFMKLKIALNLKAEDILALLELAGLSISKHELSAFFRKAGHKHYRQCKDQILRNFLYGLQLQNRGDSEAFEDENEAADKRQTSINPSIWKQS